MSSTYFPLAFLAFWATALVGPIGLLHPRWWLAIALSRLAVSLLRSFLEGYGLHPQESRSPKPLLLALLAFSAIWTYVPIFGTTVPPAWVVLVYLALDTTVDRALANLGDPSRLPFTLGLITYSRLLGAGAGVFIWAFVPRPLAIPEDHLLFLLWTLLALSVSVWERVPEIGRSRPSQRYLALFRDRGALLGLLYFLVLITLLEAGPSLDTPLPILHPQRVSLAVLSAHFLFLSAPLALCVGWIGGRFNQRSKELIVVLLLIVAHLTGALFAEEWWSVAVQRGLATGSGLLLCAGALRHLAAAPGIFATNLVLVAWSLTVTADPLGPIFPAGGWSTAIAIALISIHRTWAREAPVSAPLRNIDHEALEASRRLDRRPHGDRKLDFEYGPKPLQRKRSPLLRLGELWTFLTVKLPVHFTLVLGAAIILAAFWQLHGERGGLQRQGVDAWNTVQAQLYLSTMGRRLEEEMLASGRTPSDLQSFLSTNFELPSPYKPGSDPWGTPLLLQTDNRWALLISAGPDRRFGTEDDLVKRVSIPAGVQPRNKK